MAREKKKQKKAQKTVDTSSSILIGHAGRRPIYLPEDAKNVLEFGTTGAGKTVGLSNIVSYAIEKDLPALFVDGKGDIGSGSMYDIVTGMMKGVNKKLYVINLSDIANSHQYNPFRNASFTVAKDMLINMSDWSEEHYKLNAERFLQRTLQMLELGKFDLSFHKIVKCIAPAKFTDLSSYLLKKDLITKEDHLDNMELLKTSGRMVQGSTARFSTIAEGELKHVFTDKGIDISQAMLEKAIILFVLNPMTHPEVSPAFGRLATIDAK